MLTYLVAHLQSVHADRPESHCFDAVTRQEARHLVDSPRTTTVASTVRQPIQHEGSRQI